jgi:SAM-dependent methyltransferase
MSTPELHQARGVAESFGADAERYDRARPRYPDALIERIVARSPGREVLDVGCGTGIVARQFAFAGCQVLGVEPDARMAAMARHFGVEVEISKIEDWDPAGRQFDALTSGQAWHWVDPAAGAAKAAQVLRPGGLLALFWNAGDVPPPLAGSFAEIVGELVPELPGNPWTGSAADGYARMADKTAAELAKLGGFDEPEIWRFGREQRYSTEEWLDVLPTYGFLTQLTPERLAPVLARTGAAVDAAGGSFVMTYTTVAFAVTREDTPA